MYNMFIYERIGNNFIWAVKYMHAITVQIHAYNVKTFILFIDVQHIQHILYPWITSLDLVLSNRYINLVEMGHIFNFIDCI